MSKQFDRYSPQAWRDANERLAAAIEEIRRIRNNSDKCRWPERLRPATERDLVPGAVIWWRRETYAGYPAIQGWRIVRRPIPGASYEDEDGDGYSLCDGDFVEDEQ